MRRSILFLLLVFVFAVSASFAQETADDFFNRAVDRQKDGDPDGAIADYTKVIELDPKDADRFTWQWEKKMHYPLVSQTFKFRPILARYDQGNASPVKLTSTIRPCKNRHCSLLSAPIQIAVIRTGAFKFAI